MIKGYIFDYDGVLVNTARYHYCAYSAVAAYLSSSFSFDEYMSMNGVKREYVIEYIAKASKRDVDEKTKKYCYDMKQKVYSLFAGSISKDDLIPGAEAFLKKLKDAKLCTAVASGGKNAGKQLETLGLSSYFDVILDGNSPFPSKPAPDLFLGALERLGLQKDEVLVFEDAAEGIEAAHRGGMKAVGIGMHLKGIADRVIPDFTGLEPFQ